MSEWKKYKLGDLCNRVCSGGTPSSRHSEYYDGNIPWLNTKEINFNRIYSTEKCISEDGLNNSAAKWIDENSVIVAMYGATAGKTAIAKIPLTTNQACCNLTINPSVADYQFVYYFLRYKFVELASLANGGAQQNLNAQIIKDFEILLPSLSEQKHIAKVLSSLDDKIEVNKQINDNFYYQKFLEIVMIWMITSIINDNLEQQAQAIFKSWFVDFEPFKNGDFIDSELGRIPKGWKVGKLSDLGDIVCGKTPIKANKAYYGNDIPFIKIPDMRNNLFIISSEDNLSTEGSESQINKLLPEFSILVSCIATVGLVSFNTRPSHTNQQINSIIPFDFRYRYYLYENLRLQEKYLLLLGASGTTTFNVNTTTFSNIPIIIPTIETFDKFHNLVYRLFDEILNKKLESCRLAKLRDTLLPKLMSGELQINK